MSTKWTLYTHTQATIHSYAAQIKYLYRCYRVLLSALFNTYISRYKYSWTPD